MQNAAAGTRYQFERLGYFVADSKLSKPGAPVFNRTVALREEALERSARLLRDLR